MTRRHALPPTRTPTRQPLRLALEPRMMFDGAAIATAVAQLFPAPAAEPAHDATHATAADAGHAATAPDSHATDTAVHTGADALNAALAAVPTADPGTAAPHATQTIVFIDASLAHRDELLAAVPANAEVVLLDPARDGLQQIDAALAGRHDIDAIHLITHGSAGELQLGSTVLDADAIAHDASGMLADIGKHLAKGADVLVYGCNFGAGTVGAVATEALSHALGADVASSEDLTGATALHGNWDLERHVGAIQTQAIDAADWDGLLLFGINTPPVAGVGLSVSVGVGSSTVLGLSAGLGDIDLDGDATHVTGASALHGSATVNAQGALVYTPTPGYVGVDVITYTIADSHGAAALLPGVVAVTVVGLPTLQLPTLTVLQEDTPLVFASILGTQLSVGNIDGNLASLNLSVPMGSLTLGSTAGVSLAQGTGTADANVTLQGSVAAINAALNGLVYTPAADYNGPVNLTLGLTNLLIGVPVTLTLPINIAPVADIVADTVSTTTDHAVSFNVLANDTFENAGRVVSSHSTPSHGTVSIDAQGNASYTPTAGYNGTDTFTYTVTSNGTTETATVTVTTAAPLNHAPVASPIADVAANDAQTVSVNVSGAFSDADGDTLSYSATGLPSGLTINAGTGVISGTLGGHASQVAGGVYNVVVSANDGHGGIAAQSFHLNVSNPAPIANADSASGDNEHAITGNVLANDSDPDGDALSVGVLPVSGPAHGVVVLSANGNYSYTAVPGYVGSDSFTYRVTDADGASSTATVSLVVAAANHAPIAVADLAGVNANHSVVVNVLANDVDPDGDALHVTGASALHGSVVVNGNGTLTYTPNANYVGVDAISYTVADSHGLAAVLPGTVVVSVNADPTLSLPALNIAYEDTPIVFASALGTQLSVGNVDGSVLQLSLSVPNGQLHLAQTAGLTFSQGTGNDASTLVVQGTAANINAALNGLVYTPAADYNGPVTLTVGNSELLFGTTVTAQLPLNIVAVADIVPDAATTVEGQPVSFNVLANDTFENPSRVVSSFSTPAHGTVSIDAQGNTVYTPTAGYVGSDSFTYTVTSSGTTETATVTISVTAPVDHPPTATPIANVAANDAQAVNINVSGAFSDVDGDTLHYSATGLPSGLTIDANTGVVSGTLGGHASQAVAGGVYTVIVTADDGRGGTVNQSFHLTVSNPPPIAVADSATLAEDGSASGNVLTNDSDPDGDALTVATTPVVAPAHGTLVLNSDGSYVYTPAANYHGTDSFTYRVTDADGGSATATVTLTITAVNDAPTSTPLADQNGSVGATVSVDPSSHFSDVDGDALTYTATGLPPGLTLNPTTGVISGTLATAGSYNVTLTATDPGGLATQQSFHWTASAAPNNAPTTVGSLAAGSGNDGAPVAIATAGGFTDADHDVLTYSASGLPPGLSINATTGVISGTLSGHASVGAPGGVYTVIVTADDGRGGTATQGFSFSAVNPAPIANADVGVGLEDGTISGNVLANDVDPDGDAMTVSTTPVVAPAHGTLVLNGDGSYVYTPAANYHGIDSFTYRVTDADGGSATATVVLTTISVNDAPTSTPLADRSNSIGAVVSVDQSAAFSDVDGDPLTFTATGLPPGLILNPTTGVISGTLLTAGTFTVTMTATDPGGLSTQQSFHWVAAAAANNAPSTVGSLAAGTGNDGAAVTIATATGFTDADHDVLSYSASGLPPGLSINAATGVISGTLDGHASVGAPGGVYTVVVTANDGHGGTAQQGFSFSAINPAPIANGDVGVGLEDGTITGNVLTNDSDPDGDALTVATTPVVAPAHGTLVLNADGSYVYTPAANYHGTDSFTYRVIDADGGSSTAVVALTVISVNDAPTSTAVPDRSDTVGTSVSIDESGHFADPDGDTLTYAATGLPPGLTVDAGSGVISGTLATAGSYSVTLTASDGHGGTTQQAFHWTAVAAPNNPPTTVGSLPAGNGNDGAPVTIATATGFSDADHDVLSYSASGLPPGLSIDASTGLISGTLSTHASTAVANGVYTVVVTANDGHGGTATQGFSFTAVNPPPLAVNDVGTGAEDGTISGNVLANDSDVDGDALTVATTPVVAPAHGTLALNADGSYVYTPAANYNGVDSFTYRVTDADGGSSTATVTLTVTAVNDAPTSTALADRSNTVGAVVTVDESSAFHDVDGDVLAYTATGLPPGLALNSATGVISGTLLTAGSFTVTLTATDPSGLSTQQSFQWVSAALVNNAPNTVGSLAAGSGNDGTPVTIATAAGFNDPDGDLLSYSASGLPPGLSINAVTGLISGTLAGHASTGAPGGVYTVIVTASDGHGGSATQGFTLTAANPPPVATDGVAAGLEDGPIGGNVLLSVVDPDGDALTVATTPVTAPAHGTLVLNADGSYVYTPDANFNGADSFTYRVTDADGGSATATVHLTVAAVNDAPTSTPLADRSNTLGAVVTVDESSAFHDVDGDPLVFTATGLPPGLTLDPATGVIAGTLLTAGNYNITLTATDPSGLSTQQSFHWLAAALPNNAPNTVGALAAGSGNDGAPVAIATAAAFADPDGDILSYSASGLPPGLSINAVTGLITGTLDGHASAAAAGGVYTVIVTANDGHGGSATQGFTFNAVNPAPVATADVGVGAEDSTISGNVLANDVDPDGDALTVSTTPVVAPAHGSLVLNADGSYVYTPAANYNGVDSFTYRVTDADGGTSTATVTLTVAAVNDGPDSTPLADRSNSVGAVVNVSEASHFSDVDGDTLVFSATGLPPGLTLDPATGIISGTLLTAGSHTVTLTATDPSGAATQQSFVWTAAAAANNAPDTVGSLATGSASDGAPVAISTAGAFHDADGDLLSYSASGLPPGLTINAVTGVISGTLTGHASTGAPGGVYTVIVTADDGHGGTAQQGFSFTAVNPAPVAVDDVGVGLEDGTIRGNVLANDSDPDGDALTVNTTPVLAPMHGTLVLNADGSYVYTPAANYNGTDAFAYQVTDADGGSHTATVTLTVLSVDDAPTSTPLADRANSVGAVVSVNEAAHFSDVDGDPLSFSATGLPPGLTLDAATGVISGTLSTAGSYTVTLTATDAAGLATQQSFHWIAAAAANNGPNTVGALATGSAADGGVVTIATAAGFIDPDGDTLSFSASGLPPGLSIDAATGVIGGTLASNASSGAPGGVYTIVVTANDGHGGTVSQAFGFSVANPAPVAADDVGVGPEGGTIRGNVLANDVDPDGDALTVGTTPVVAPTHGTLVLNADGSYVYTPAAHFNGADSFTYRVTDADGGSHTATVTLTVTAVNDAPTSTPLADRGNTIGTVINVDESAHFHDADGEPLVFSATGLPPGLTLNPATGVISGTLLVPGSYTVTMTATDAAGASTQQSFAWTSAAAPNNGPNTVGTIATGSGADGAAVAIATATAFHDPDGDVLHFSASGLPPGLSIDAATGVISGTLDGHASAAATGGVYTVIVSADDGRGGTASLGFTFTAANPAPVVADAVSSGAAGATITGNVLQHAVDADGDALAVDPTPVVAPVHGTVVINADGSYVYTPAPNYAGSDSFTYRVTDADGGSATATVHLTVAEAPGPSVVAPISMGSANDGAAVTIPTADAFHAGDANPLAYSASGLPPGLTIDPATGLISGTLASNASTAAPGGVYTIVVSAADGAGHTVQQSFTFAAANPAPVASAETATVGEDGVASGNVLSGVHDPDGDKLVVDTTPVVAPAHGTLVVNADGSYHYTPAAGYTGSDSFTVRVTDADGKQVNASVSLTVTPAAATAAAVPPAATATADPPPPAVSAGDPVTPQVGAGGSALSPFDDGTASRTGGDIGDTLTQTQIDARSADTEIVLTQAINGINRLEALGDLSVDRPLIAAVNAMRSLGGNTELGIGGAPMAQVVGDLNGAFRAPLRVDTFAAGPYGANGFAAAAAPVVNTAPPAFAAPVTPPPAPVDPGFNSAARLPITLTEQLRTASLRTNDELEALALALN